VAEYDVGNLSSQLGRDADAVAWLRRATDHGYPLAATNLLWFYDRGRALPGKSKHENWNAGIDLFERLASEGNVAGQFAMASALFDGNLGLKSDPQRAAGLLGKVAESGWPRAQYALGNLYFYGKGVAKDKTEAFEWLHKAADQADAEAQGFLAEMYLRGDGTPKDLVEGYKWRLLAWRSGIRAPFRGHLDAADEAEAVKRANEWEADHGLVRH
jgi:TPR repeat protein